MAEPKLRCLKCGDVVTLQQGTPWKQCSCESIGGRYQREGSIIVGGDGLLTTEQVSQGHTIEVEVPREYAPNTVVWLDSPAPSIGRKLAPAFARRKMREKSDGKTFAAFSKRRQEIIDYALEQAALHGATMDAVGSHFGVTRQRIQQILIEAGVKEEFRQARSLYTQLKERESLYKKFAELAKKAEPCRLCGYWVLRRSTGVKRTCSARCAEGYAVLRRVIDEEELMKHRMVLARRALKSDEASRQRWGKKVLEGQERSVPTYVIEGSYTHQVAQEFGIDVLTDRDIFDQDEHPWKASLKAGHGGPKERCQRGHLLSETRKFGACSVCRREREAGVYAAAKQMREQLKQLEE